jgi:hypothetical protein
VLFVVGDVIAMLVFMFIAAKLLATLVVGHGP